MGFLDPSSWANALSSDPTGAKGAAQTQADWQNRAIDLQTKEWQTAQDNQKPWLTAGTSAVNALAQGLTPGGQFTTTPTFNFNPSSVNVNADPGYQFRLQTGANALSAAGLGNGGYGSGNMGTALVNYGQQLGSQEYSNAYNRAYQNALDTYNSNLISQNTVYNRLAGIAGTGQNAASTLASQGGAYAANTGNILSNIGSGFGQAAIANKGAFNQGLGGLSSSAGNALNNYLQYNQQQNALNAAQWGGGQGADAYGSLYSNDMSLGNATMNDYSGSAAGNWFSNLF